jgi:hypothetical protein
VCVLLGLFEINIMRLWPDKQKEPREKCLLTNSIFISFLLTIHNLPLALVSVSLCVRFSHYAAVGLYLLRAALK